MSTVTFILHRKSLNVRVESGSYTQKITFQAKLPKGDRLYTHIGKEVRSGYVEFVSDKPKYETELIWFIDEMKDLDTGAIDPPSVSFYAHISLELLALIRDSHSSSIFELKLNTGMLGAIQFDDSLGYTRKWNTSQQNPVPVESYELLIRSHDSDV